LLPTGSFDIQNHWDAPSLACFLQTHQYFFVFFVPLW
jgi:hypothetical protein